MKTLKTKLAIKQVIAKPITMVSVYFLRETVSINLPAQIIVIALKTVAIEYKLPNCVFVRSKVPLKSWLKREIKKVCPKPEENAIKKPKNKRWIFL